MASFSEKCTAVTKTVTRDSPDSGFAGAGQNETSPRLGGGNHLPGGLPRDAASPRPRAVSPRVWIIYPPRRAAFWAESERFARPSIGRLRLRRRLAPRLGRLRPPVQLGGQVRQLRGGAFEPRLEARLNAICMMRVSSEYLAVNRERDSDFWASHR